MRNADTLLHSFLEAFRKNSRCRERCSYLHPFSLTLRLRPVGIPGAGMGLSSDFQQYKALKAMRLQAAQVKFQREGRWKGAQTRG